MKAGFYAQGKWNQGSLSFDMAPVHENRVIAIDEMGRKYTITICEAGIEIMGMPSIKVQMAAVPRCGNVLRVNHFDL